MTRTPFNRRLSRSLLEGLEGRRLLTTVAGSDGRILGYTDHYTPAGGIVVATPRGGSGSGDGLAGFQIKLNFTGGLSESQKAVFTNAAQKWESILTSDVPDMFGIDDIEINASGVAIDGPNKVLGQAGPTHVRNSWLPYRGEMQFDTADLGIMESSGALTSVIVHEMGHVLGLGTLWAPEYKNLITGSGGPDPVYTGAAGLAEYRKLAGLPTATSLPVENTGGDGTRDGHIRESYFDRELMTGYINAGSNPLSRISAASLIDLGYGGVNIDAADVYTIPISVGSLTPRNHLPTVGTLLASPATTAPGTPVTLTLSTAADADGSVARVSFYRESNGIAGLQASGSVIPDALLGNVTTPAAYTLTASTAGLTAGTYTFYARAADNFGAVSSTASATATLATVVVPGAPSAPALAASSDTGVSNADGITFDNTPTFTGTAVATSTVTLRAGVTVLGTTTADAAGNWSFTADSLADGAYSVTATAGNAAGTSPASAASNLTVDTVGSTILSAAYDRDLTQDLSLTFGDAAAAALLPGSVSLQNLTAGTAQAIDLVTSESGGTVARLAVNALLANGNYSLSVPATAVTDVAGNPLTAAFSYSFRQQAGDMNDDGTVDFGDLLTLAQNYGQAGRTFSQGNVDYDPSGTVEFSDLLILAQNYGVTLAPPMAPLALSTSTASPSTARRGAARSVLA